MKSSLVYLSIFASILSQSSVNASRGTHVPKEISTRIGSSTSSVRDNNGLVAADTVYEETKSTRMPFAGSFATSQLVPTGWTQLNCANISSISYTSIYNAVTGKNDIVPLGICPSVPGSSTNNNLLLDINTNTFYTLQGTDMTTSNWTAAQSVSGADYTVSLTNDFPAPLVYIGRTSIVYVQCSTVGKTSVNAGTCNVTTVTNNHNLPNIQVAGIYSSITSGISNTWTLWIGGTNGTSAYDVTFLPSTTQSFLIYSTVDSLSAVAYSPAARLVALGNGTKLALLNASDVNFPLLRWEWVTYVPEAVGGVIDDVITSLAFDDVPAGPNGNNPNAGPILYIGNPTSLNIGLFHSLTLSSNYSSYLSPVYVRVAGVDGLPYNNITSLTIDTSSIVGEKNDPFAPRRVYIGTLAGVILFDPTTTVEYGNIYRRSKVRIDSNDNNTIIVPYQQRFRYFAGGRWLPVTATDPVGSQILLNGLVSFPSYALPSFITNSNGGVFVLTIHGIAFLNSYTYTLQQKAMEMETTLPMYNLSGTGLIGGCYTPSFGTTGLCTAGPDENNGLWTSLLVTAFAAKYGATNNETDADYAARYLDGLYILNAVTGIQGLFARCALPPGVPHSSLPSEHLNGITWHNSTSLPGWTWEGDTSSDEVAGHNMAYVVAQEWLASARNGQYAAAAAETLIHLVRYVVGNNFTLVDVTGNATTWGHWEPSAINQNEVYSDERGLNAVEMFGMLAGALESVTIPNSGGGSNDTAFFVNAANYLLSPAIDYGGNMVNAKIIVPDDDNYSDDELLYFAYYALLLATNNNPTGPMIETRLSALASISRSWSLISFTRPSLWNIMSLSILDASTTGYRNLDSLRTSSVSILPSTFALFKSTNLSPAGDALPLPDPVTALADAIWDMRTWPLDPLDWPVLNSIRMDITFDPEVDRDIQRDTQSLAILPGNERTMFRWNANPRQLDGGGGQSAVDPGGYLMPYWIARRFGFLNPPS